jgi:hypothetical protein
MAHRIPVFTQDEDPTTMALPIRASNAMPGAAMEFSHLSNTKSSVQLNLIGVPSVPVTKSVVVPSSRKKNCTLVAAHTQHVSISKSKSAKKVSSHKKKATKNYHVAKFVALDDYKESASLTHSLCILELQNLMKLHIPRLKPSNTIPPICQNQLHSHLYCNTKSCSLKLAKPKQTR